MELIIGGILFAAALIFWIVKSIQQKRHDNHSGTGSSGSGGGGGVSPVYISKQIYLGGDVPSIVVIMDKIAPTDVQMTVILQLEMTPSPLEIPMIISAGRLDSIAENLDILDGSKFHSCTVTNIIKNETDANVYVDGKTIFL